jgi:hypothetical protein
MRPFDQERLTEVEAVKKAHNDVEVYLSTCSKSFMRRALFLGTTRFTTK